MNTIEITDLDVIYSTTIERRPTLAQTIAKLGRGDRIVRKVHAVKNLNLDVKKGQVLGIVGHNGAGKSTLLKAIAGIIPPTSGKIMVRGNVNALLSLGVGFNPALSGDENILLAGLADGRSRDEIEEKRASILELAELGDFIEMPIRTYSSGMVGRLGFSIAVHMDPEILLIDEALSAGDASFKVKARDQMERLIDKASTIIMVSHSLSSIEEMCNDAIWLSKGALQSRGNPSDVINEYTKHMKVGRTAVVMEDL